MKNSKEKHIPNYEQPMEGMSWFRPKQCIDCIFRNKTTFEFEGKIEEVGWHKGICAIYEYPECKPSGVLKNIEECDFYEADGDRVRMKVKRYLDES